MPEIEHRWKKRLPIEVLPWDETNFKQVREFAGKDRHGTWNARLDAGLLSVWNDQECAWIAIPVGHRVVKGALGELYPLSPKAYSDTTEAVGDEPAPPGPIALGQLAKDWEALAAESDHLAELGTSSGYVRHAVKATALRECARQLRNALGQQS
jgi:hypothetical protein